MRKSIGHGKYNRSLRMTESAIMRAWLTSEPFIPARILMLFVENVERSDIYA